MQKKYRLNTDKGEMNVLAKDSKEAVEKAKQQGATQFYMVVPQH